MSIREFVVPSGSKCTDRALDFRSKNLLVENYHRTHIYFNINSHKTQMLKPNTTFPPKEKQKLPEIKKTKSKHGSGIDINV